MLKIRIKNNKHSAVWLVEPKVSVGRASENEFVVNDASVEPHHVDIQVNHENLTLVNVSGSKLVTVNGKSIEKKSPLHADDILGIGNIELEVVDPKREQRPGPATTASNQTATGWALKANHTALSNRVFPIKKVTIVGRSNECDITLAAAHLSRRHAQLTIHDGLLYAKDLGSSNGTYLNGKRIVGEERVRRGDELRFDTLSFGVIGPAQDMDKTTVRPVPTIKLPADKNNVGQVRPNGVKNSPRPDQGARININNTSPQVEAASSEAGGSKGALIWIAVIIVVLAAGAGLAFQQGLIG